MDRVFRFIRGGVLGVALISLGGMSPASGAEFFVDYAAGDDLNTGTSALSPFRHSPGDSNATGNAATANLAPGDAVVFKRGVTYHGSITLGGSGAVIHSGSTASVTGSGLLSDSMASFLASGVQPGQLVFIFWSKKPGLSGWACQTSNWVESTGLYRVLEVAGEHEIRLEGYSGRPYLGGDMTYGVVKPITLTSRGDWGAGEAVFEGDGALGQILLLGFRQGILVSNLTFANTAYDGEDYHSAINGSGSWNFVRDCVFRDIANSSIGLGSRSAAIGNRSDRTAFYGIGFFGDNCLVADNTCNGPGARSTTTGKCGIIRGNRIKDMTVSFQGKHADGIGFLDGGANGDKWYGWIYGNTIENAIEFIALYSPNGGPQFWVVHSNIFIGRMGETGYGDAGVLMLGVKNIKIYNNTFTGIGTVKPFGSAIRLETHNSIVCKNIEILNNLFSSGASSGGFINITPGNTSGVLADFNHAFTPDNPTPYSLPSGTASLAQWKSAGYDKNGPSDLVTSPAYRDLAANPPDLRLTPGSTYDLGKGKNLSSFFRVDWRGNLRSSWQSYSLGALEFRPTQPDNLRILP